MYTLKKKKSHKLNSVFIPISNSNVIEYFHYNSTRFSVEHMQKKQRIVEIIIIYIIKTLCVVKHISAQNEYSHRISSVQELKKKSKLNSYKAD